MTRDELRFFAQNRYPVVQRETGAHGEIVYPYIREIKVIYASEDEIKRGFPRERIAVSLGDKSGHSFTDTLMRDLRLPSENEAERSALPGVNVPAMLADIRRLKEYQEGKT